MKEYQAVVTWDEQKNKTNVKKHNGISFELAQYVFLDECMLVEEAGVVDNEKDGQVWAKSLAQADSTLWFY